MNNISSTQSGPIRVAVNAERINGPYGGANRFTKSLINDFQHAGHYVTTKLERGLDILFIVISHNASRVTFSPQDAAAYKAAYPNTIIVQRINACDEQRGGSANQNAHILAANKIADHTVFVSEFMQTFWKKHGIDDPKNQSMILTGSEKEFFHSNGGAIWDGTEPFRLVTHHWSANVLKGFDIYQRLDQMLEVKPWRQELEFTYVGNTPPGFVLENTTLIPPADNEALAEILRSHHGYISGSRLEPGGNHYIEAMQCGLPVLHINSGSLPEYCAPYGTTFNLANFVEKLIEFRSRYDELRSATLSCPYDANIMINEYILLAEKLVHKGSNRTTKSHPMKYETHLLASTLRKLVSRVGNKLS